MKYVIMGSGAAGLKAAERLRSLDKTGEITVASEDPTVYSRCLLHRFIAGERTLDGMDFMPSGFFIKNDVRFLGGAAATVNFDGKTVHIDGGVTLSYDRLLIATGSRALLPPIPGLAGAENVFTLRNFRDAEGISSACGGAAASVSAAVIGAGLVGMDAAQALLARGVRVSVIEMADRILPLQLDKRAAGMYRSRFEAKGAAFYTNVSVAGAKRDSKGRVRSLELSDGRKVDCDFCVVAAGVRPDIPFLVKESVTLPKVGRGIAVDSRLRTSVDGVYAAGDVTGLSGIWPLAAKQGIAAAENMAGLDTEYTDTFSQLNAMNFCGLPALSVGEVNLKSVDANIEILHAGDVYKKFVFRDGLLLGAMLVGDVSGGGFYTELIKKKIQLRRREKLWEESYADHFEVDKSGRYYYDELRR